MKRRPRLENGDAYREADVAVIPTGSDELRRSRRRCGCRGLNDLIIDGHNGRLVPPTEEALYKTVRTLLPDAEERRRIAKQARLACRTSVPSSPLAGQAGRSARRAAYSV